MSESGAQDLDSRELKKEEIFTNDCDGDCCGYDKHGWVWQADFNQHLPDKFDDLDHTLVYHGCRKLKSYTADENANKYQQSKQLL